MLPHSVFKSAFLTCNGKPYYVLAVGVNHGCDWLNRPSKKSNVRDHPLGSDAYGVGHLGLPSVYCDSHYPKCNGKPYYVLAVGVNHGCDWLNRPSKKSNVRDHPYVGGLLSFELR